MTAQPSTPETQPPALVRELPLAPLTMRSVARGVEFSLALGGLVDDPGIRFRDTGEIFRLAYPRLRGPLREITDVWIDGWTGETVMLTSPRLVRELLTLPAGQVNHEVWKKFLLFPMGAQSPFVLDGRDHQRVRRAITAEFTPARVEGYRERSVHRLDEMIDELPLHTPIKMHEFHTRFTQEIILRVVFGWDCHDLDELKAALYDASRHYIARKLRRMFAFMLNCSITLTGRHNPPNLPDRDDMPSARFARTGHRLRKRTDELIYRKIAELRDHPNDSVAARLIAHGAREAPAWTDKRLRDIIATLLIAGHDTSVLAYDWALQYLLHNPGPRDKVIAEARAGRTDRYAQAANTEALRMRSPVIGNLPFPANGDIAIGGYRIRKNSFIFAYATAVHHNEELYPEPETFRPERWLDTRPDPYGFMAFGARPHRCPGSTFYLTEASVLLHRLFGRLDLRPCQTGVDPARFTFGTLNRPKGDTEVIVRSRRPAADVPWYRPGRGDRLTPLKDALRPEDDPGQPARCPYPAGDTSHR